MQRLKQGFPNLSECETLLVSKNTDRNQYQAKRNKAYTV
jgi:hypothetical protein